MNATLTRKPAVAGQFYPREPELLRETVQGFIDRSGVEPSPTTVEAIVTPHAGYVFSGPSAGHAFARVRGKQPKRVLLLGCSHRYHIPTAAVYGSGAFETPLGTFPIDGDFADTLIGCGLAIESAEPHLFEHSLEVQLPFLAVAVGTVPIVPILFGTTPGPWHGEAGERLAVLASRADLAVVSTDLSHYLDEDRAERIDRHTLDVLLSKDWRRFAQCVEARECFLCAGAAVTAGMAYALARGANEWKILEHRTSGRASGDFDRVVGYAAVSMERGRS